MELQELPLGLRSSSRPELRRGAERRRSAEGQSHAGDSRLSLSPTAFHQPPGQFYSSIFPTVPRLSGRERLDKRRWKFIRAIGSRIVESPSRLQGFPWFRTNSNGYMYTYAFVCVYIGMYKCFCIPICIYVYVFISMYKFIYIYMNLCVHMCTYVFNLGRIVQLSYPCTYIVYIDLSIPLASYSASASRSFFILFFVFCFCFFTYGNRALRRVDVNFATVVQPSGTWRHVYHYPLDIIKTRRRMSSVHGSTRGRSPARSFRVEFSSFVGGHGRVSVHHSLRGV